MHSVFLFAALLLATTAYAQQPAPPDNCAESHACNVCGAPTPVTVPIAEFVMRNRLVDSVQPVLPPGVEARGSVIFAATISAEGKVVSATVIPKHLMQTEPPEQSPGGSAITGPPELIQALIDAVKKRRYKPFVLNGEPIEVETEITINFP